MARQKGEAHAPELQQLQRRVENWRKVKQSRGTPMPEDLWAGAVSLAKLSLAQRHGIRRTAREVSVDPAALKKRVAQATGVVPSPRGAIDAPAELFGFVEVDAVRIVGDTESGGPTVELSRPDGAQMVIRMPPRASLDIAHITAAFCGGGR